MTWGEGILYIVNELLYGEGTDYSVFAILDEKVEEG
jgi:hypothetical protein